MENTLRRMSDSSRGSTTSAGMNHDEQKQRRASIQKLMQDPSLTPQERRASIQSLMDGRRRSSSGPAGPGSLNPMSSMAAAAAVAAEFYDSSDEEDDHHEDHSNHNGFHPHNRGGVGMLSDQRSVGSSNSPDFMTARRGSAGTAIECADPLARRMELKRPECTHYDRNCTIISPCCGMAFGCRICHDDCPTLPPPMLNRASVQPDSSSSRYQRSCSVPVSVPVEESHHEIDRFAIKEVICRQCFTRQGSKTNQCIRCKITFGEYHCNVCNLWMSNEEEPYHCNDCGFCRVGGRNNFQHCHDCGMCIDALLFDDHNCKAGKYMSNCPVCQEDLFSSRSASHEMPCGHAIHWHCFRELTSFDTRCPVCKKTAETHEHMAPTWSAMAMGIALQPVPPEMARVVTIICNDCEEKDEDRRWHFLGVQCLKCTSFNTTIENTTMMGQEAAAFLGDDMGDIQRGIAMSEMLNESMSSLSGWRNSNANDNSHAHRAQRRHSVAGNFMYGAPDTSAAIAMEGSSESFDFEMEDD